MMYVSARSGTSFSVAVTRISTDCHCVAREMWDQFTDKRSHVRSGSVSSRSRYQRVAVRPWPDLRFWPRTSLGHLLLAPESVREVYTILRQ